MAMRVCYNWTSLHPLFWPFKKQALRCASGCKKRHCGSGGTGRHTILRGWRRKAWGFKSPLPHQDQAGAPQWTADSKHLYTQRQLAGATELLFDGKPLMRAFNFQVYIPLVGDLVVVMV